RRSPTLMEHGLPTEFPSITRSFFSLTVGSRVTIVTVGGACEATPHLGIADAIVDLSSSGTTLRTNHLRVVEEIFTSTTILVANPAAPHSQEGEDRVNSPSPSRVFPISAKGQCYLMMNVHGAPWRT
ncbi:MAG: hypothetical protein ACOX52_21335, partial [Verrucomicrobiota bacterium]